MKGQPLPAHRYSWRRAAWPAYLRWMRSTNWPILVGPWHGEIGFEALYWLPFLERLVHHAGLDRKRFIPISRGGAAVWYGCETGLELYGMRTPQQVRIERRLQVGRWGIQKPLGVSPFDRSVLADAAATMKLRQYHVLHPAWMYHLLAPFWVGERGISWLLESTRYQSLPPPPLPSELDGQLPASFVAVRFYGREGTFPQRHPTVAPLVKATVETIAQSSPVVILDAGLFLDEHVDLTPGTFATTPHPILRLRTMAGMLPERNLALQSAVLARAIGFVGTYGGFAQLALRLGRPSVSFFTDWGGTAFPHKALADFLSLHVPVPFQVFKVSELMMTRAVLPIVEVATATSGLVAPPPAVDKTLSPA